MRRLRVNRANVGTRTLARRNGVLPTPVGTVTTLLGTGLLFPSGVAVIPSSSTIVIADTNNSVIKLLTYPGLSVSILAGTVGANSFADGTGAAARFAYPLGVAVLQDGNIVVADTSNNRIRVVTPAGVVTTLAGSGAAGSNNNGTGTGATFNGPSAIAVLQDGNIVVSGEGGEGIRLVTYPGGVVTTLTSSFSTYGLAVLPNGNIAATSMNHTIRLVTYPGGVVTTLAGNGTSGSSDGTGSAARFYLPTGLTATLDGNIVVSDFFNYTIRLVTPLGVVTTIAGLVGTPGSANGTGTVARFNRVRQLATLPSGQIVLAAESNYSVRMLTYPA